MQDLPVNPAKLLRMTWPLYALMALSVLVNPASWWPATPLTLAVPLIPLLLPVLGWVARGRWRLEVTPDALVHHTLRGSERFEWTRMGSVGVSWIRIGHLPVARSLLFAYPIDTPRSAAERITALTGRRLMPVFGDRPLKESAAELELWRAMLTDKAVAEGRSVPASALSLRR